MEKAFIKIPNNVIDFATKYNNLTLPLFVYLKKFQGSFGEAEFSINSLRDCLFFANKNLRGYREDILEALGQLSSEIHTQTGYIFPPQIKVKRGKTTFIKRMALPCEGKSDLDKCILQIKDNPDKWYNYRLNATFLNLDEDFTDNGFTIVTKIEIDKLEKGIENIGEDREQKTRKNSDEWRGPCADLYVGYFAIKKIINRNHVYGKKTGGYNWENRISKTLVCELMRKYKDRELRGIFNSLVKIGMITEEMYGRKKYYHLNFDLDEITL